MKKLMVLAMTGSLLLTGNAVGTGGRNRQRRDYG